MRRRRLIILAATLSIPCGVVRASADQPSAIDLVWNAPAECPGTASVEREINTMVESPVSGGVPASAVAVVALRDGGWTVVLTTIVRGVRGRRMLEARSCDAAAHMTALVLALAIDPHASASSPATDGGASPAAEARVPDAAASEASVAPKSVSVSSRDEATAERARSDEDSSSFNVAASVTAGAGPLPRLAFAPRLDVSWSRAGWRLGLGGAYFPPVRAMVDSSRGGEFRLFAAAARFCKSWGLGEAFELGPCVTLEGGIMSGKGLGVRLPASGDAPWMAARGGIAAALRLGASSFWLVFALDGEVPLTRLRFEVDRIGTVHQASSVGLRTSAGAEVRF